MRKPITTCLFFLTIVLYAHAQGTSFTSISQIGKPYKFLIEGAFYGKNFFFDKKWAKGKLLLADNSVINADSLMYNYDKIEHRLLMTSDFKKVYEIDKREFKAILFYLNDSAFFFKRISYINDRVLFQVLVSESSKYSLYKVMRTKFVRASYGSVFLAPNPKAGDAYIDAPEYYILSPNKEYRTLQTLKKPNIERAFDLNPDSEKVNEYLDKQGEHDYQEQDLIKLIAYLNSGTT